MRIRLISNDQYGLDISVKERHIDDRLGILYSLKATVCLRKQDYFLNSVVVKLFGVLDNSVHILLRSLG